MATKAKTHTKKELVHSTAAATGVANKVAESVISHFLNEVVQKVTAGEKVSIHGFGIFDPRDRAARSGHNPSTGEVMQIPATRTVGFKASASFKTAVKSGNAASVADGADMDTTAAE